MEEAKRKLMEKVSQSQEAAGSASSELDYKDLLYPALLQKQLVMIRPQQCVSWTLQTLDVTAAYLSTVCLSVGDIGQ